MTTIKTSANVAETIRENNSLLFLRQVPGPPGCQLEVLGPPGCQLGALGALGFRLGVPGTPDC